MNSRSRGLKAVVAASGFCHYPIRERRSCGQGFRNVIEDRHNATPSPDRRRRRWHFASSVLDERTMELLVNGIDVQRQATPQ
jgi:hypothetical protein